MFPFEARVWQCNMIACVSENLRELHLVSYILFSPLEWIQEAIEMALCVLHVIDT